MVGGIGLEPMASAMSTLEEIAKRYLEDRKHTRGLTRQGELTLKGHLARLVKASDNRLPTKEQVKDFLGKHTPGARRRLFDTIRALGRWLEREEIMPNPWKGIDVPKVPIPLLPAISPSQVEHLLQLLDNGPDKDIAIRNKTIIAVFMESGLRLEELANIKPEDIDWQERTITVWGKGQKQAKAPFGALSESLLKQWLAVYSSNGNIWGMNRWGIQNMLKRLKQATGIPCNAHSFRRAFASMLKRMGIDSLTIKTLGRWESLAMVDRYTKSVTFEDSLKHYKSPMAY
jgi:site-specific recombinase XerD